MRGKILSMGEAVVDVLPAADGLWRPVPGGSSYNVALALGRLGAPAAFVGRLSRDEQGEAMTQGLAAAGVDLALLSRDERPSPLSLVSRGSEATSARYSIYLDGTAHAPPTLPDDWLAGAAHLHVSSFSAISGAWGDSVLAALAQARGTISASLDINIRPALIPPPEESRALIERRLALVDMVKASDEDLAWLFPDRAPQDAAADWAKRFGCLVLLTRGADGATAISATDAIDCAAPRVKVADTVGAGDTFVAAFLARAGQAGALGAGWRVSSDDLAGWLAYANAAAALCCARSGADAPTTYEINAFLSS